MAEPTDARGATRARIVDVAARLLQTDGPAAVTTRAVAEGAGVQAPTIYRLFGDKEGLLDAVGARDLRPTPTGRIVVEAARGAMPAFVETGLNLVDVEDVARGHLLALAHGRIGERYILGGQDVSLRELLLETGRLAGRSARPVPLPRG